MINNVGDFAVGEGDIIQRRRTRRRIVGWGSLIIVWVTIGKIYVCK